MTGRYEPTLVTLSVVIASLASYVALDLAGRITAARGRALATWLLGGSLAMGVGIWSMHFVGMLAFRLPVPTSYDVPLLILSVLVAVVASLLALTVVSRQAMAKAPLLAAGLSMGAAIAGMHYIGMASMRMPAQLGYHPLLVAASIAIAVGASLAALWLAFHFRGDDTRLSTALDRSGVDVRQWKKAGASVVMGLAIAGMHYTAMAAAQFTPVAAGMRLPEDNVLATSGLATAVVIATLVILTLALLGAMLDRYVKRRMAEAEEHTRLYHEAEAARAEAERHAREAMALARQLENQQIELEQQVEEAELLSEELAQANQQLQATTAEAERARDEAEAARERVVTVLESISDAFTSFDRDWRFTYINPAAAAIFRSVGKDPGRLLGRVLWEEIPDLAGTAFDTAGRRAVTEQRAVEYEDYRARLGRWFNVRIYPSRDGVSCYVRDVTARKWAEEALRESEQRFRVMADTAPVMIWLSDTENLGTYFNRPWLEFTGRLLQQELGHGWAESVHPDDLERSVAYCQAQFNARQEFRMEFRLRRADGAYRWVLDHGIPRFTPDGTFLGYIGSCIDITERREAEERKAFLDRITGELGSSLDYERTLTTLTRCSVPFLADYCSVDLLTGDGRIRRVETAHVDTVKEAILRDLWARYPYDPSERVGVPEVLRTGAPVLVPEISEDATAAFARDVEHLRLLRALGPRSYICVPLASRGRTFGALSLVMSDSGRRYTPADLELADELARRAAIAVDNARLYSEAQAANRAKAEFLATMSHELRTPINATIGYVELIELGIRGPITGEQRQDLERVRRSQQHLLGIITDILNFTRIEAGQLQYDLRDVAVHEVLAEAGAMIEPQAQARSLTYDCGPCSHDVVVRADREKLHQVVLNLLSNAVKFSEPGGRIVVTCDAREAIASISVRDSGIGIPADKLAVIFEPFVQLDRSLTRRAEGTGLGLAISRDLARHMGGDLTVESVEGEGSVFTLTLPRAGEITSPLAPARRIDGAAQSG